MSLSGILPPAREPAMFEVVWTDPVTGCRGYLVIDSLVRGLACGGLRMREGCTLQELRDLAHGMTLKEAVHLGRPERRYIPVGGAKGGIDFDPDSREAPGVLRRYVESFLPWLRTTWITGDDLGINLDLIDDTLHEAGISSPFNPALPLVEDADAARRRVDRTARIKVGGVDLGDLVGGFGVAVSCLTALGRTGLAAQEATAVVQGFGNMGGAAARYLSRAGVRIVGIADIDGLMINEDGFDVEALLLGRDRTGRISRGCLPGGTALRAREEWAGLDANLLVPAATPYVINASNAGGVKAQIIAEAANAPTTMDAERELHQRGVIVLPDFLVNSATNAWWWWLVFGDLEPTADASFAEIEPTMRTLTETALATAEQAGTPVREAAVALAADNVALLRARFPSWWSARPTPLPADKGQL